MTKLEVRTLKIHTRFVLRISGFLRHLNFDIRHSTFPGFFMRIAAVCCTYLRPVQLGQMIHCFLRQDYPAALRELVILDDAGQYANQSGAGWRLVSAPRRFETLGRKRNAAARLVSDDADAVAVWDDDDLYLPWALRASAAALAQAPWSRPSVVLHPARDGSLRRHLTGGLFHAGWSYRRKAFDAVGGYPDEMSNGEDQGLAARLAAARTPEADPIALGFEPFYVYRWGSSGAAGGWHLSGLGPAGYQKLGAMSPAKSTIHATPPPDVDLDHPNIDPEIHPRVF